MGRGIVESALRGGAGTPGLRLIETFRLGSPRVGLHRARMARGAAALGWAFAPARFEAALAGADPARGQRLRLTMGVAGDIAVEQSALPASPSVWRLGLARRRLASADPWLALKSTNRPAYDAERASLAEGLDEALFLNERDEVCDGTITTLFFDRGEGLRTPPLACGLLPGVLRAEMACPEEVLAAGDLARVRLWVGNALRGLMPAVWVG